MLAGDAQHAKMQHARSDCPSATLRRTLKRRSRSTYEASECASVTSASSAFSVPAAAIFVSCKPAALQRWVHSVSSSCEKICASERAGRRRRCARQPHQPRPYRLMRLGLHVARAHACVRVETACSGGSMTTCDMRHTAHNKQHATCNVQQLAIPGMQMTRDLCREASCSATGAAQLEGAVV